MNPIVEQYLEGIRKAMGEVILPELAGNPFAVEQATLILATLGLLIDVQQHQDAYMRREQQDFGKALEGVFKLLAPIDEQLTDLRQSFNDVASKITSETPSFEDMRAAVQVFKAILSAVLERVAELGEISHLKAAQALLIPFVERQIERELSWQRMTGFDLDAKTLPNIGDVLERQSRELAHRNLPRDEVIS